MRYTVSPLLGRVLALKIMRKAFAPAPVTARFETEFPVELALRPSQIRASAADTALMIPAALALGGGYGELAMPVATWRARTMRPWMSGPNRRGCTRNSREASCVF